MFWIDLLTADIGATKKPKFFKSTLFDYGMGDRKLSSDSDKDLCFFRRFGSSGPLSLSTVQLPVERAGGTKDIYPGVKRTRCKSTTIFHLVSVLRMHGALPPSPHTSSCGIR